MRIWNSILVSVLACSHTVLAVDPVVDVGYSQYRGRIVGDGTTQWLGMRYAAPPLETLRFSPPQDPLRTTGILDASKFGPICIAQSPSDWTNKPFDWFTVSDDCLYINVFAPSHATPDSRLPVMYFIQGGGFTSNSNQNYNASDLARNGNMVVVSINYRVGPHGFLWGKEVLEGVGKGNAGIRDIIMGLEWVRDRIAPFGGSPSHVVLDGDSAGAAAIVLLLTSPAMKSANLFIGAIIESTYQVNLRTLSQAQTGYDCLAKATGCSTSNSTSTLSCLRSLNATALQTTTCTFNPHIEADLIPDTPFHVFAKGEYLKIPTIFGSCLDEGTHNAPQTTNSVAEFNGFVSYVAPSLSASSIQILDDLYINNVITPVPVFPNSGALWRQASNAAGDIAAHCVSKIYQDRQAKDGVPTWNYRYAVKDPEDEASGEGVYHTVNLFAWWGAKNTDGNPPKSYLAGGINDQITKTVQPYWTNFVNTLNPNTSPSRHQRRGGGEMDPHSTPLDQDIQRRGSKNVEWQQWGKERRRLRFETNATRMETEEVGDERRRCEILEPLVRVLEQVPPAGTVTDLHL